MTTKDACARTDGRTDGRTNILLDRMPVSRSLTADSRAFLLDVVVCGQRRRLGVEIP